MTPKPRSAAPRSVAETLLAVQLEQAGIPFEAEYRFHPTRKWRADFFVPHWAYWHTVHDEDPGSSDANLLIEVEGGSFVGGRHTRGPAFEADCEKYAAAAILGYRVIRVTPRQVEDGRALSWIRQALGLEERAA
jgi:hypothetical protein